MSKYFKTTVCIPTLNRNQELETCLRSIHEGTVKPTEIIIKSERGPLASIRNEAGFQARGDIIIFIDDDVTVSTQWLESILTSLQREGCDGVSGPAVIRPELRANRDIFKYRLFKRIYDQLFLDGKASLPGHFTDWGAWTTGACEETCSYEGEVHFLEACNMSFKREIFHKSNGFGEYAGVGDWSEPDLCFKIRGLGGKLFFNPNAKVYHNVSKSGAYGLRLEDSKNRLQNFFKFADRHLKQGWKLECYKLFVSSYYAYQTVKRYAHSKTR